MVQGCGATTAKVVLIIVNVIFVLLGLGMGIAGLVFKFGTDVMKDDVKDSLSKINLDMLGNVDVYKLVDSLSNLFIIVGFIIFAIGFFGCCGACCQWRWMLVIYAIVVMLLLIAQIAAIALFASFKGEISSSFSEAATKVIKEEYQPGNNKELINSFNKMFQTLECCGINNYTDIDSTGANLPKECCSGSSACTKATVYEGCYTKLNDLFSKYTAVFIGVGVGIIVFQLLCIIFSFCLCVAIGRDEKMV